MSKYHLREATYQIERADYFLKMFEKHKNFKSLLNYHISMAIFHINKYKQFKKCISIREPHLGRFLFDKKEI